MNQHVQNKIDRVLKTRPFVTGQRVFDGLRMGFIGLAEWPLTGNYAKNQANALSKERPASEGLVLKTIPAGWVFGLQPPETCCPVFEFPERREEQHERDSSHDGTYGLIENVQRSEVLQETHLLLMLNQPVVRIINLAESLVRSRS